MLRRLVFQHGRWVRIGGDSRVRYAYCQEYMLPALLNAADRWVDPYALLLAENQLDLIYQEASWNQKGSFFIRLLVNLAQASEYYFTRFESDRAYDLAQVCAYYPLGE